MESKAQKKKVGLKLDMDFDGAMRRVSRIKPEEKLPSAKNENRLAGQQSVSPASIFVKCMIPNEIDEMGRIVSRKASWTITARLSLRRTSDDPRSHLLLT